MLSSWLRVCVPDCKLILVPWCSHSCTHGAPAHMIMVFHLKCSQCSTSYIHDVLPHMSLVLHSAYLGAPNPFNTYDQHRPQPGSCKSRSAGQDTQQTPPQCAQPGPPCPAHLSMHAGQDPLPRAEHGARAGVGIWRKHSTLLRRLFRRARRKGYSRGGLVSFPSRAFSDPSQAVSR